MQIRVLELLEGAKKASGLTVVIDVFRAFSCASYALARGAAGVVPTGSVERAMSLRESLPGSLLIGERGGRIVPGFDCGNSPSQLAALDVAGRAVVQTTSGGTQALMAASGGAEELLLGSFTTADAIIRYILARRPETVSLVATGKRAEIHAEEDFLCAKYIEAALLGRPMDHGVVRQKLREAPSAARFFEPENADWAPEEDFRLCSDVGRFDFIMRGEATAVQDGSERLFKAVPVQG
ncbi:MAG: 2-phosphosulfolactate phosphatase [Desulfovibrionaceae bacterium]|nr:2-phosphosulfolactate phosphatase [Desulfovibrionaceae bacterium]